MVQTLMDLNTDEQKITSNPVVIENEVAMETLGACLARTVGRGGLSVALQGPLGAGKTTLARGFLREWGYLGTVKSPTFTLVEPYDLPMGTVYHFDLYRLLDPEELELIGVRDYFVPGVICLVEWPEKGEGMLPVLDLRVDIHYQEEGRIAEITAGSPRGGEVLTHLLRSYNSFSMLEPT